MILAALLLLQAQAEPPADDIVVIGERLKRWSATLRTGKKGSECRVKRSSGDPAIDAIGCAALQQCLPPFQSRYQAAGGRGIRPETRRIMRTALDAELSECMTVEHRTRIAALAAERGRR